MTRLVSWNVNGIRAAARKGLFDWLAKESPDILCLQETKAWPEQLEPEFLAPSDGKGGTYRVHWAQAKRKGYSGVALFSKREPRKVEFLGVDEFDDEGRVLIADYGDFFVISAYFPNSQDAGARLDYKLRFCEAVLARADAIRKAGKHVVVAGDYNIAHKPIDLANPEANVGNPGYLPEERAWMDRWVGEGFADSLRHFDPSPGRYTWWTYRVPGARERNVGWRLDYHCVDEAFLPKCAAAGILADVLGSDHCPVSLDLALDL
ncbi:MAG TPA: exodeoxyribonuclease III [Rectinemataceae bacterium]|nr:exodeoxyribonuclease III [Rectinemataceae bacterium]